jgi:hypothetical protein
MGRRNRSSKPNEAVKHDGVIIGALISATAIIIAALIALVSGVTQTTIPIEATETAEALRTSAAMNTQPSLMLPANAQTPISDIISSTQSNLLPVQTGALTQVPTSIPFGNQIFGINFSVPGEGICNDYDSKTLGYDISRKQYYIIPYTNGYASVCHKYDNLQAQGSLQTTAFPDGSPSYFGYAVFFGWKGDSKNTTDACGFGVRKNNSKVEAIFIQIIGNHWNHTSINLDASLDTNPHSIRMVLYPSGKAVGYLDGNYVAEHSFIDCALGPVGLIAYGPGQVRINFNSLKLFDLP